MPSAMQAKTMYIGEIWSSHAQRATEIGIQIFFKVTPADFPNPSSGAAISATTAGRIPLKILSTIGLVLNCVNIIAMSNIEMNDGKMTPAAEKRLPLNPRRLFPTNNAVLSANGPGMD